MTGKFAYRLARIINHTREILLGERVDLAITFPQRLKGLLGRREWGELDGLWIEPCSGVHGMGLSFPIDVVLVDESLLVLWVQKLRPWRLGKIHFDAWAALELPLGTVSRSGTTPGDLLILEQ